MKQKVRILFIGILLILSVLLGTTYAYWLLTESQNETNRLVTTCLNLKIEDERGSFGIENAYPMSDEEGASLSGYTFKIVNHCNKNINYLLGLDSLTITEDNPSYLGYKYLKVQVDNENPVLYENLENITRNGVRASKQLKIETLAANQTVEHIVRIWVDQDTPVSEQMKEFEGQIYIIGAEASARESILASGDISKIWDCTIYYDYIDFDECDEPEYVPINNVQYNLYELEDGTAELEITGTGEMMDFEESSLLTEILINYLNLSEIEENILRPFGLPNEEKNEDMLVLANVVATKHTEIYKALGVEEKVTNFATLIPAIKNYLKLDANATVQNNSSLALLKNIYDNFPLITKITIANGVKSIGERCFIYTKLTSSESLVLPNSIKKVQRASFVCFGGNIILNEGLEKIKNEAFLGSYLTDKSIVLPSTLVYLDLDAFNGTSVVQLEVPTSVKAINGIGNGIGLCMNGPQRILYTPNKYVSGWKSVINNDDLQATWNCTWTCPADR